MKDMVMPFLLHFDNPDSCMAKAGQVTEVLSVQPTAILVHIRHAFFDDIIDHSHPHDTAKERKTQLQLGRRYYRGC